MACSPTIIANYQSQIASLQSQIAAQQIVVNNARAALIAAQATGNQAAIMAAMQALNIAILGLQSIMTQLSNVQRAYNDYLKTCFIGK